MMEHQRPMEMRAIAALRPYPGNARTHSAAQIRQIAQSIKRFGFTNPVLISDDDEIIAGHGRVAAAKQIGQANVPVIRLSHLGPDERRAYVLADNKLALNAGWDNDMLAIELQYLVDIDFDIGALGFSTCEIDLAIGEAAKSAPGSQSDKDDEVPPLCSGARGSLMQAAKRSATPRRCSTSRNSKIPPSDDNGPPSNRTSNRLPQAGDRPGSGRIGSSMAGVAFLK